MNNLLHEGLDTNTISKLLMQEYIWKPNKVIPQIFPYKNEADRISDFCVLKDKNLHNKLMACFENANKFYNYNLDGKCSIKIQRYKNTGHIDWHMDEEIKEGVGSQGTTNVRMLSMSVLLNDNFKGGKMLIKNADNNYLIEYDGPVGKAVIFPSTWIHKVEPVTNGERYVLTAWAYGDI